MTLAEIMIFFFLLVMFGILVAKFWNIANFGNWYDMRLSIGLWIFALFSNILIFGTTMSLTSATAIPPTNPSQEVQYVVEIPASQLIISGLISRYSGFMVVLITFFTFLEVLFALGRVSNMFIRKRKTITSS